MSKEKILSLYYLTPLKYPSVYANRMQVLKMTEAFARITSIKLFVSRIGDSPDKLLSEYHITSPIPILEVKEGGMRPRALFHALSLRRGVDEAEEGTIFYIRDIVLAFWLTLFSGTFRKRFFFESHSLHRFSSFLYSFVFRFAKGIIVTNQYKKDILVKRGMNSEKIIVEPNAIDDRRFSEQITREDARKKLNLSTNEKIVLYLGLFTPDRGTDAFLNAGVLSKDNNVHFYAVGGNEAQVVEAKKTHEFSTIHILGRVPYDEVHFWYRAADVLVAPWSGKFELSRVGASPLKIPEYMYSGTPIVISDLPMTREFVDESNVFFSVPDNPESVLKQIMSVLGNSSEGEVRAKRAREKAKHHTWNKRAERIVDFIKNHL